MSRKLDIGVASYRNPNKLRRTLESISQMSTTDFRCIIVHNPSDQEDELDAAARAVIGHKITTDSRFVAFIMDKNVGYAGAVNKIFEKSETEYVAYCDNDINIVTPGWDETLCKHLDAFHEIGIIFPNGGGHAIPRGLYDEVLWGVGYCFIMNRMAATDSVGGDKSHGWPMDPYIGHQEEADLCMRVRMSGWKCAALPAVMVEHNATSSNDASAATKERINRGVVNFVNKWCRYFGGKNLNYNSPNVLRWEDWPPNALYLEEYWKTKLPDLNASPEKVTVDGREYDLIKVPRYADFYNRRII